MSYKWIFILFCVILLPNKFVFSKKDSYSSWIKSFKLIKYDLQKCLFRERPTQTHNTVWSDCMKDVTLKFFDDIMSTDIITIMDGVQLVRTTSSSSSNDLSPGKKLTKTHHHLSKMESNLIKDTNSLIKKMENIKNRTLLEETWFGHLLSRIYKTLSTHILQIDISKLENDNDRDTFELTDPNEKVTGRHRRRNNMMMAMMFGVTAMGAIIVPVGFQLLSVISGKALLLAKMALLLASISGLKKIASSGINYGLYHLPEANGYGYGYGYDRGDANLPPRFPRNIKHFL